MGFVLGFIAGIVIFPLTAFVGLIAIAGITVPLGNLLSIHNNSILWIIYAPYAALILGDALIVKRTNFLHGFLVALPLPAIILALAWGGRNG